MEIKRKQPRRRMIRVRKKIKKRKKKKKIKMKMMRVKRKKIMELKKNSKNQKRSLEDKLSVSYITSKGIKKREKKLLLLDLLLKAHLFLERNRLFIVSILFICLK